MSIIAKVWELSETCDCSYCKGGRNKHAWSFYYYLKKAGDRPVVEVRDERMVITVYVRR